MEKKEIGEEIIGRLFATSDKLFLVAIAKGENLLRKPIGADLINIGKLKQAIQLELDKAREEGKAGYC